MPKGINADGSKKKQPKGKSIVENGKGPGSSVQKDGRKVGEGISIAKYEAMADAYFKKPTIGYVEEVCGVTYETAKKYIERGNLNRTPPMPAIRPRYLKSLADVSKVRQRCRDDAMKESQIQWQHMKTAVNLSLAPIFMRRDANGQWHVPKYGESVEDPQALKHFLQQLLDKPIDMAKIIDIIMRGESFSYGGADMRIDDMTAAAQRLDELISSEIREWTDEEKKALLERGERPAFMRPRTHDET